MNRITFLLCCILCANSVHAEPVTLPDDLFPTNIWVNGVDRKSEVLLLTENNLYYVECQDLEKLQLNMGLFKHHEPYRVCRRPSFLRECPDEKSKIYP